jgi:hypothetical protein
VWAGIKELFAEGVAEDIFELDMQYNWTQLIFNYVQDMEMELSNAGLKMPAIIEAGLFSAGSCSTEFSVKWLQIKSKLEGENDDKRIYSAANSNIAVYRLHSIKC